MRKRAFIVAAVALAASASPGAANCKDTYTCGVDKIFPPRSPLSTYERREMNAELERQRREREARAERERINRQYNRRY